MENLGHISLYKKREKHLSVIRAFKYSIDIDITTKCFNSKILDHE